MSRRSMRVYVDHTHLGRAVTGLERITQELFSPFALAPLDAVPVAARGTAAIILTQTFGLPALPPRPPSLRPVWPRPPRRPLFCRRAPPVRSLIPPRFPRAPPPPPQRGPPAST